MVGSCIVVFFTKGISGCDQHSAYQYRDIFYSGTWCRPW